ncbi:hypothetical protein ACHAWO_000901 [Cyclotella atomus]|uniref:RING-type domain-containing protein n=1 Tax=Cyclotella atomus TaxID=382360 RepID=A0ABD3PYQ7_9STRA
MGIESNSQQRWRTARERTRLKARYEIHSRIANVISHGTALELGSSSAECEAHNDHDAQLRRLNATLKYLQSIIKNDLSSFSIASLSRHQDILDGPLPSLPSRVVDSCGNDVNNSSKVDLSTGIPADGYCSLEQANAALACLLSTRDVNDATGSSLSGQIQPATLATSKFGRQFVTNRLLPYLAYCQDSAKVGGQITLLEYASLLGRHGIVGQLLLGGVDPTVCGYDCWQNDNDADALLQASRKVLALLHSLNDEKTPVIPLSLWSYIVRAVIDMRINGALLVVQPLQCDDARTPTRCDLNCRLCNTKQPSLLMFGPPCQHEFCESCLWLHLVQYVPNCINLNHVVVTCPCCQAESQGFQCCESARDLHHVENKIQNDTNEFSLEIHHESKHDSQEDASQLQIIYEQRRIESLTKFNQLPSTSSELKILTKNKKQAGHTKKKLRDPISATWYQALHPKISNHLSKDVRTDRFFKAVISSPQLVMCYLQSGIDVNMQNEYGQTPLYVACWRGSAVIVQCLLEYGADVNLAANGGGTCWGIAERWGRRNVLCILERYGRICRGVDSDCSCLMQGQSVQNNQQESEHENGTSADVTILIEPCKDHPGAGACIVDDSVSESDLQRLEQLGKSLPLVACDGSDDKMNITKSNDKVQYRPNRSYYCDSEQVIQDMLQPCIDAARIKLKSYRVDSDETVQTSSQDMTKAPPSSVFHHLRFLHYNQKGGLLPPHVDLCRVDDSSGHRSTHTFILYLTNCKSGGGTALLQHLSDPKVLAVAEPKRGRALIFPHMCPHSGQEVDSVPKILLRGEVVILS